MSQIRQNKSKYINPSKLLLILTKAPLMHLQLVPKCFSFFFKVSLTPFFPWCDIWHVFFLSLHWFLLYCDRYLFLFCIFYKFEWLHLQIYYNKNSLALLEQLDYMEKKFVTLPGSCQMKGRIQAVKIAPSRLYKIISTFNMETVFIRIH